MHHLLHMRSRVLRLRSAESRALTELRINLCSIIRLVGIDANIPAPLPASCDWMRTGEVVVIISRTGFGKVTYNFLRTLTAEWRPDRREGTARLGVIRVVYS